MYIEKEGIAMGKHICVMLVFALLLTGCGGNEPKETAVPITESAVMTEPSTEPTTVPTEPKNFFEEQGYEFWEGFRVYDTLDDEGNRDGGLFAEANILDATECEVTITGGDREVTTYRLADTNVEVVMEEYTLAEFDEECKENNWGAVNIKNASNSIYKAFMEDDTSLTKEDWLEQYKDYKVICCYLKQTIKMAGEIENAKLEMNIGQSQWGYNWNYFGETPYLLNCIDGSLYVAESDDYPGIAEVFSITTEAGSKKMAAVADWSWEWEENSTSDVLSFDNLFVMVPSDCDDLIVVLPLIGTGRTLEDFEAELGLVDENAWEEKTFSEYTKGKDHLKYYFLSPYHY